MSFYLKVEVEVGRKVLIGHNLSLFSHVMTPPVHAPYLILFLVPIFYEIAHKVQLLVLLRMSPMNCDSSVMPLDCKYKTVHMR
jgi:hypothetical protein